MKKILSCFDAFRKNDRFYFMLLVYFLAQIILSGLASFVIPFFSNKVFSEQHFSNTFYICMSIWFGFAVLSSLLDYYGNRYNLKTYYKINEIQYEYQIERFLKKGYKIARKMKVEDITSRLMRDTQMMTNIVLWVVGVLAMISSFLVVLIWGCSIFPIVLLIFVPQCMVSSILKSILDKRIAVIKDKVVKMRDGIKEYQLALNNGIEVIREDRFLTLIYQKIKHRRNLIYRYTIEENILQFLSETADYVLDVCAKALCVFVFYKEGCYSGAVILPFFTVQATFRNQFLSCQDNISSIRQNAEAVERIEELINQEKGIKRTDGEFICKLENVGVIFHGEKVINNMNLSIKQGEKVAIAGENGSGKTTVLRIIMGLISADEGECMAGETAYSPVNIQLFPENFEENIEYLKLEKEATKKQQEMLETQILTNQKLRELVKKDNMCRLSGGQQKIISHLRAVLCMRDILVMDEPLAALDAEMSDYCVQLLKEYRGTLIVATHDQRILNIVNRVVNIEKGI